jgi:hypothetical protein
MGEFTKEQEESIEQKIELFRPLLAKKLSEDEFLIVAKQIEDKIIKKRLEWYEKNKNSIYLRGHFETETKSDIDKAFRLLIYEYMKINYGSSGYKDYIPAYRGQGHSGLPMSYYENGVLVGKFRSEGFCPYSEAFKIYKLKPEESAKLCKIVLEKPCQELVEKVNPKLIFFRDYSQVRPITDYCLEGFTINQYDSVLKLIAKSFEGKVFDDDLMTISFSKLLIDGEFEFLTYPDIFGFQNERRFFIDRLWELRVVKGWDKYPKYNYEPMRNLLTEIFQNKTFEDDGLYLTFSEINKKGEFLFKNKYNTFSYKLKDLPTLKYVTRKEKIENFLGNLFAYAKNK